MSDHEMRPCRKCGDLYDVADIVGFTVHQQGHCAAKKMADEKNRADHWMAVALAFRDATTSAAIEARDGECDPYLERAQNLFNETATGFGPLPAPNRFYCDSCEGVARVDEDGCCAACGRDTWPVFEAVRE